MGLSCFHFVEGTFSLFFGFCFEGDGEEFSGVPFPVPYEADTGWPFELESRCSYNGSGVPVAVSSEFSGSHGLLWVNRAW